jgi:putative transposase
MPSYRKAQTACVVRIIPLRGLSKGQTDLCSAIRQEAGRCWTEMLHAHIASRCDKWLSSCDLEKLTQGQYALHSQTVQALAQRLDDNVDTARQLRKTNPGARYPYKDKYYQTVIWKDQAIRVRDGMILLPNGRKMPTLNLPLPAEYHACNIRKAELTWRADHYELCITIDSGILIPPLIERGKAVGVDLGEINMAAAITEEGEGVVISGRYLRSINRLRNKRLTAYQSRIDRCQDRSKRKRKLLKNKRKASARYERQQRDILHKASRQLVNFCQEQEVAYIAVGDVKDIQTGVNLGRKSNQKISQWPHGQFVGYVSYKARRLGMSTDQIAEDYSTKTCSECGQVLKDAPRGRVYRCPGCGVRLSRDGNGGANICSRFLYGEYASVQINHLTYLRPLVRSRAFDTSQCCLSFNSRTPQLQPWGVSDPDCS